MLGRDLSPGTTKMGENEATNFNVHTEDFDSRDIQTASAQEHYACLTGSMQGARD